VALLRGDITAQDVDAIVNAANPSLMGGGGVDGAIHRAGGPVILEQCRAIRKERGDLPTGEAVITSGGRLPARYVIHTVGPVWHGGAQGEADLLAREYGSSMDLAARLNLRSIAFPSISTGIYGFPVESAAPIALATVIRHLHEVARPEEVRFVLFSAHDLNIYEAAAASARTHDDHHSPFLRTR
jgi:O-acetyl-ADP-ribose deacetylase (regulator of RNase III)